MAWIDLFMGFIGAMYSMVNVKEGIGFSVWVWKLGVMFWLLSTCGFICQ
jgi:hypothetical protein